MNRIIILLLFSLLSPFKVIAAITGYSGTIADGESIIITGSGGFGSGPNVVVFDDFEAGVVDTEIAQGAGSAKYGAWNSTTAVTFYDDNSSVSGDQAFSASYNDTYFAYIEALLPTGTQDVFISWWLYIPIGTPFPGEGGEGINWKQMWVQGAESKEASNRYDDPPAGCLIITAPASQAKSNDNSNISIFTMSESHRVLRKPG